jgi:two-component system cell cycle sensor histidine kinase/response regulator CckA
MQRTVKALGREAWLGDNNWGDVATILIAEDQTDLRKLIRLVLETAGHEVIETADAASALRTIGGATEIDLFLTDFRMPDMTGTDAIVEAQRVRPGLPCLIVTGDDEVHRASSLSLFDVGVVRKPFAVRTLLDAVRKALATPPAVDLTGRPQPVVPATQSDELATAAPD